MPGGVKITVGRAEGASVRLSHDTVSRIHCTLELDDSGRITLSDNNSANGTKAHINGQWRDVAAPTPVQPDTMLLLGEYACTARKILARCPELLSGQPPKPPGDAVFVRDPETGQVVKK